MDVFIEPVALNYLFASGYRTRYTFKSSMPMLNSHANSIGRRNRIILTHWVKCCGRAMHGLITMVDDWPGHAPSVHAQL